MIGSDPTWCVRFAPDGTLLASANVDKTVSLWDLQAGQESARLIGHRAPVVSLAFHPGGNVLASAGCEYRTRQGEILIWDVRTQRVSKTLEMQDVEFSYLCFSPDGTTLASVGPRNAITLWDVATWTPRRTLEPHNHPVSCLDFSPDGKLLAAGVSSYNRETEQAEVKLWNMESGEEVGTLSHRWGIQSLCFSPDGKSLAVADQGQVVLWDVESQVARNTIQHAWAWATFSPDGSLLAMKGPKVITVAETTTFREVARQEADAHAEQPSFSPDGTSLAWGTTQGKGIRLWDLTDLK